MTTYAIEHELTEGLLCRIEAEVYRDTGADECVYECINERIVAIQMDDGEWHDLPSPVYICNDAVARTMEELARETVADSRAEERAEAQKYWRESRYID